MILLQGFNHVCCNINGKSAPNRREPLMSVLVVSALSGAETAKVHWGLMETGRGLHMFISEETLHKKRIIELVW